MNPFFQFFRKLSILAGRKQFYTDLAEEMAFHRAETETEFVAKGMSPDAARDAAKRQFGNATRLCEQSHEVVGFRAETVVQDVQFAMRQMRQHPGFALTAILILALGVGVSVAIFGFVDAALLEPLPYANPNRLMAVDERTELFPRNNLSGADYEDWKRLNHSFSSLDVYTGTGYLLGTSSGAVPVPAARVSDGFFRTLGVKPMLGRTFLPGEDQPNRAKVVVLTYGTWMDRYGGRTDLVGRSITLSGDSYTIVGVLSQEFAFAPRGNAQFYVPLQAKSTCDQNRSCHYLDAIGRLRDGVTVQAALADLKSIAAQLEKQYPDSNRGQGAYVAPLADVIVGQVKLILFMLLGAAGLLLLIACFNVAGLLLVRSESRRREIAVRGAVGATPVRLIRQFVTEGLLLSALGCGGGLAVAIWLMGLLTRLVPHAVAGFVPFLRLVGLNAHTAFFAAAIAVFCTFLLASTPALRLSFQDIRLGLGEDARTATGGLWRRLGANLVVVELAIAVVLLVGAGLLGQSFYRLLHVDNGFDTTHLATVQVIATSQEYAQDAAKVQLYRDIESRLSVLPGVRSVGITGDLPDQCNCDTDWIRVVGKPFHGEHNDVLERDVSANYLPTLKARLVRGQLFGADEDASKPRVVVINQAFARKYFPGEDPIGHKIANMQLEPKSIREIVGVVADVREGELDADIWPAEYEAINQAPNTFFAVAVRTSQDEKAMLPGIVAALHKINPNLGVYGEISMTDQIESSQTALLHRFASWLLGGFAVVAFALGVVGLYGVVAYSVSQRTREIGVRMALGAQRATVYKMVMRQAGWLTFFGVSVGLVCAVGASMLMRKILFGVQAWDAPTLAGVAFALGAASLAASFFPAHRAASVSPTEALRAE